MAIVLGNSDIFQSAQCRAQFIEHTNLLSMKFLPYSSVITKQITVCYILLVTGIQLLFANPENQVVGNSVFFLRQQFHAKQMFVNFDFTNNHSPRIVDTCSSRPNFIKPTCMLIIKHAKDRSFKRMWPPLNSVLVSYTGYFDNCQQQSVGSNPGPTLVPLSKALLNPLLQTSNVLKIVYSALHKSC